MSQPFVTPAINIQSVLSILYPYAYSREMMDAINWDRNMSDNDVAFDCAMCITLLGGQLPKKSDFNHMN